MTRASGDRDHRGIGRQRSQRHHEAEITRASGGGDHNGLGRQGSQGHHEAEITKASGDRDCKSLGRRRSAVTVTDIMIPRGQLTLSERRRWQRTTATSLLACIYCVHLLRGVLLIYFPVTDVLCCVRVCLFVCVYGQCDQCTCNYTRAKTCALSAVTLPTAYTSGLSLVKAARYTDSNGVRTGSVFNN